MRMCIQSTWQAVATAQFPLACWSNVAMGTPAIDRQSLLCCQANWSVVCMHYSWMHEKRQCNPSCLLTWIAHCAKEAFWRWGPLVNSQTEICQKQSFATEEAILGLDVSASNTSMNECWLCHMSLIHCDWLDWEFKLWSPILFQSQTLVIANSTLFRLWTPCILMCRWIITHRLRSSEAWCSNQIHSRCKSRC